MAAYLKTDMPFYGVQKAGRVQIARTIRQTFRPTTRRTYQRAVEALWNLPHREEKYLAIHTAHLFPSFVDLNSLSLYERLIREGGWWDLVDETAIMLIGRVWLQQRDNVGPIMDRWIQDPDPWIRRAALIAQVRHKQRTDDQRLFRYCRVCASETALFIRKAIGWALRDYSISEPESVTNFLVDYGSELSGLSYREASRRLPDPLAEGLSRGSPERDLLARRRASSLPD
jgi:3-methyladenine DNA glycosylase AlkD